MRVGNLYLHLLFWVGMYIQYLYSLSIHNIINVHPLLWRFITLSALEAKSARVLLSQLTNYSCPPPQLSATIYKFGQTNQRERPIFIKSTEEHADPEKNPTNDINVSFFHSTAISCLVSNAVIFSALYTVPSHVVYNGNEGGGNPPEVSRIALRFEKLQRDEMAEKAWQLVY